jgi:hypothetical protein
MFEQAPFTRTQAQCFSFSLRDKMLNDMLARRMSQSLMFQNIARCHGPLWRATQVTREPLDGRFLMEEFMRVNGVRAMPLAIGPSTTVAPVLSSFAWNDLIATQAPAVSARAEAVQRQTPLSRQLARGGLVQAPLAQVRADSMAQVLLLDSLARSEGVIGFTPLNERADMQEEEEDRAAEAAAAGAGGGDAAAPAAAAGDKP